jgi:hypothetical protein
VSAIAYDSWYHHGICIETALKVIFMQRLSRTCVKEHLVCGGLHQCWTSLMVELAIAHEEIYERCTATSTYTRTSWSRSVIKWQWRIDTKLHHTIDQRIHYFPFSAMHYSMDRSHHFLFRVCLFVNVNEPIDSEPVLTHHAWRYMGLN